MENGTAQLPTTRSLYWEQFPKDVVFSKSEFEQKFMVSLRHLSLEEQASNYVKLAPTSISLYPALVRRIQEVYRNLTSGNIESNIEFVITEQKEPPAFRFDPGLGDLYKQGIGKFGLPVDKVTIYGLKSTYFPIPLEIMNIEQNNYVLSIRVLQNGMVIMYGNISSELKKRLSQAKESYLEKLGGMAWAEADGIPAWYKDFNLADISTIAGADLGIWKVSRQLMMPLYLSDVDLNAAAREYQDIFVKDQHSLEDLKDFSPIKYEYLKMNKVYKKNLSIFGIDVI